MDAKVDIHMPVKRGGFVVSEVIDGLLGQNAEWVLYVDASDDFSPKAGRESDIVELAAMSAGSDIEEVRKRLNVAHKRNNMLRLGESPYVYLADSDVALPSNGEPDSKIFESMIDGLERHPRLGAIGVPYQNGDHVGAGAMMLRREDLLRIGDIRGIGSLCTCAYISQALLRLGLYTIPLRTVRATHLKSEYIRGCPEHTNEEALDLVKSDDGRIRGFYSKTELGGYENRPNLKLVFKG